MKRIPFLEPRPPSLLSAVDELRQIEQSGVFSNFGPVNRKFESNAVETFFGGRGACLTVCNATIGLMLAIKAAQSQKQPRPSFALMPAYTFAATAHAALWAGMTPLFCDVDEETWLPSAASEEALLKQYGSSVAVIAPYATFGASVDIERYERLSRTFSIPVVIDAAASLGSLDWSGEGFGAGFSGSIVFSMHVTKTFSTSEGGLVYSGNPDLVEKLRTMSNFGFGEPRHATMAGLNGKMSEVAALLANLRLHDYPNIVRRRTHLYERYSRNLPDFTFQAATGSLQAHQFVPVLLPDAMAGKQEAIIAGMADAGIGVGSYFQPHLGKQSYFIENSIIPPLPVSDRLAARTLSLPLSDTMSEESVALVCDRINSLTS